jgi:hypothetical protein
VHGCAWDWAYTVSERGIAAGVLDRPVLYLERCYLGSIGFEDIFAAYERLEKPPSQYAHGPPRAALFAVRRFLTSRDKSTMDEKICEANGGHAFLRFFCSALLSPPNGFIPFFQGFH